ncbi:hypothetical protein [Natrinema sp. SYSU A 869]|uniref:hypothetical protein n=1 Tax=Natrinema sp. SYSU A 869 TaxID=2871694 RepID=UPI001CA4267C|nr:hypothetical protein [Natrinema sp. SYSU A 869]
MSTEEPHWVGVLEQDAENPAVGTFPATVSTSAFDAVTFNDLIYWGYWKERDYLVATRHLSVYDGDHRFTQLGQSLLDGDGSTTLPPPVIDRITQWGTEQVHCLGDRSIPIVCFLVSDEAYRLATEQFEE